ncbi:MAG: WecB/TagA/CpsF family glycosyltransferase [Paracoccaceae bacterium]
MNGPSPAFDTRPAPAAPAPVRAPFVRVGVGDGTVAITEGARAGFLADLDARLAGGTGFAVATVNLDHLVKLRHDPSFRAAYARHTHVTADGRPVVWLAGLAGRSVELVTGSDLIEPLLGLAARQGRAVAFVGATEATLAAAERALAGRVPGLRVACRIAPRHGFDPEGAEADAVLDRVAESGARVVLLALGAVRQERLAARGLDRLDGVGFVSIGAGLDFYAGTQVRAPRWMRRLAIEWLWRLSGDPRRLGRRYLDCAMLLPRLAVAAVERRSQTADPGRRAGHG